MARRFPPPWYWNQSTPSNLRSKQTKPSDVGYCDGSVTAGTDAYSRCCWDRLCGHDRDVAIGNPDRGRNQFVLICVPMLAMPTEPARRLERRLQNNHKWSWHFTAVAQMFAPPTRPSLLISDADELTVLPRAIRAVRESESLRGENHSHREGDSH